MAMDVHARRCVRAHMRRRRLGGMHMAARIVVCRLAGTAHARSCSGSTIQQRDRRESQ